MENTRIVLSKPVFLKIADLRSAKSLHISAALIIVVLMVVVLGSQRAQAQAYTVLYSFKGVPDGAFPWGGVVQDRNGNLYGTTEYGGTCGQRNGCGTVFKVDTTGAETVLHSFQDRFDGLGPEAGLVLDWAGNIYGTAHAGGCNSDCVGTVFKLNPTTGTFKVLHRLHSGTDDGGPSALTRDSAGNLYGTASACCSGLIFKLDKSLVFTVLHAFTCETDGCGAVSGVIRDADGNLYGAAEIGGDLNCYSAGCGTIFKLDAARTLTVLHTFHGKEGKFPFGPLARAPYGTVFGVTLRGGNLTCNDGDGCGTVFKISKTGKYTVLFRFSGADGAEPIAGLIRDRAGNLYGTTWEGGSGYGVVFKVDSSGRYMVLHTFAGTDGAEPYAPLMLDKDGNLYGTASQGGTYGKGVVFKITP